MNRLFGVLLLALATALVGVAAWTDSRGGGEEAAPPPVTDPHGADLPSDARVVLLSRVNLPASPPGRLLNARLEAGTLPATEVAATVRTDSECTPDAVGVSHCRNELRLRDGTLLVTRHSHRMAEVPCLSPGEKIVVRPV